MKGLDGKSVLVTGGASGIGEATVARFVEEGSRVVVLDRNGEALERVASEQQGVAGAIHCDVSDPEQVERAYLELDALVGPLDVLINNAGFSIRHRFMDITLDEWRRTIDTNLTGLFHVAQLAARRMLDAGRGVILNMGSMNGLIGCPNYADYNASKAGVIELTRTMALELAPTVRVLCVCPGAVMTPMQEAEYTAEMIAGLEAKIPMGRHAKPAEIAAWFAFLASDEAGFACAHPVVLDGGESAGGLASHRDDDI